MRIFDMLTILIIVLYFIIPLLVLFLSYMYSKIYPHIKFKRGIMAGFFTLFISSFIFHIYWYITLPNRIREIIGSNYLIISTFSLFLDSLIIGSFIGSVYAVLFKRLPSNSPIIKGIVLGIVYSFYNILTNYLITLIISSYFDVDIDFVDRLISRFYLIVLNILIFGFLIGLFWIYLERKEEIFYPPKKISSSMA